MMVFLAVQIFEKHFLFCQSRSWFKKKRRDARWWLPSLDLLTCFMQNLRLPCDALIGLRVSNSKKTETAVLSGRERKTETKRHHVKVWKGRKFPANIPANIQISSNM